MIDLVIPNSQAYVTEISARAPADTTVLISMCFANFCRIWGLVVILCVPHWRIWLAALRRFGFHLNSPPPFGV